MPEGKCIGPGIFSTCIRIRDKVENPDPSFIAQKIEFIGIKESFNGHLIHKCSEIKMGAGDDRGGDIHKHHGVHIVHARLQVMVHRFIEEDGNEVSRVNIVIVVYDRITCRNIQSPEWFEGEEVRCDEFAVVHNAV